MAYLSSDMMGREKSREVAKFGMSMDISSLKFLNVKVGIMGFGGIEERS